MIIPQLQPLLKFAASLEEYPEASDIAAEIKQVVARASTPSMAQNACEHFITMSNPKGWGDRCVSGMSNIDWCRFLSKLSDLAAECGQAIYDANRRSGA